MNYDLEQSDRQMVLLALAELSIRRPGWNYAAREVAKKLGVEAETMFDMFKDTSTDPLGRPLEVMIDVPREQRNHSRNPWMPN